MRVLVTRPAEDAAETAAQLEARGHSAIVAPLLRVRFHDGPPLDLAGVQAILATSANGVRAVARRTERRDLPLFAVGSQTAAAARAAGFAYVRNAQGDALALALTVRGTLFATAGALLHAASAEADHKLATALQARGFSVRTEVLYDVPAVDELPDNAHAALTAGAVDAVLIYSARSAKAFAACVIAAGLSDALRNVSALCISAAAAKPLARLPLRAVGIAAAPNQDSLLSLLG